MSNFLQEWHKNKTPIRSVVSELRKMLGDKYWDTFFTKDPEDFQVMYSSTLGYMRKTVHLSHCGYASSIYSENLALQLIRDALSENVENIAKWLLSSDTSMQLMIFSTDGPIGTVVFKDHSIDENIFYALMCLKKCDTHCRNVSGFFVEYIFPLLIGET